MPKFNQSDNNTSRAAPQGQAGALVISVYIRSSFLLHFRFLFVYHKFLFLLSTLSPPLSIPSSPFSYSSCYATFPPLIILPPLKTLFFLYFIIHSTPILILLPLPISSHLLFLLPISHLFLILRLPLLPLSYHVLFFFFLPPS